MKIIIKNEDYVNFMLNKLEEYDQIGFKTTPYMMFCECADEFGKENELDYHEGCKIFAIAYDFMDCLSKQGFFTENQGMYTLVKKVENIELGSITENNDSFVIALSEKLEK